MQNFGVTIKEHYGMLWYFLEWSIHFRLFAWKNFRRLGHFTLNLSMIASWFSPPFDNS